MSEVNILQIESFLSTYCKPNDIILDVGGLSPFVADRIIELGCKYKSLNLEKADYIINIDNYKWDIPDETFDCTISICTFEHIEYPWLTFAEMIRVTKPNGYLFIYVPSSGPIHPAPYDCWRILPDGMNALAKLYNITVIKTTNESNGQWYYCSSIFKK